MPKRKYLNMNGVKNRDIIVIRINRNNELATSRPCYNCLIQMKKYNVRRVYYIDIYGKLIFENVKDMISIQFSKLYLSNYNIKYNKSYTQNEFSLLLLKRYNNSISSQKSIDLYSLYETLPITLIRIKIINSSNKI